MHYELSAVVEIWPALGRSSRRLFHQPLASRSTTPRSKTRSRCVPQPAPRTLELASYAGQQETYLNVNGLDTLLKKIVECWLSFFTDRAVFYRAEKGSLEDIAMAVIIQQMIESKKSGVLFTVDPVHGRKDRMVVEAAFGLGENVVDGRHTPDHYSLDRKGTVKRSHIVGQQVLDESELKSLVELGRRLEGIYGRPLDIEWAFDQAGDLFLLQSRPITTI